MKINSVFLSKLKRHFYVNSSTLSILKYIRKSLTEEELESFAIGSSEKKCDFMDRAIAENWGNFLTCSKSEAKAKIRSIIEWYRNLPNRNGHEDVLFMEKLKQFLGPEGKTRGLANLPKTNPFLYFLLEIIFVATASAIFSLILLKTCL